MAVQNPRKSEWFDHESMDKLGDNAELGDLLEFRRKGYSHWGVYVGMKDQKHSVVHLSGSSLEGFLSVVGFGKSTVKLENVGTVAGKGPFRINNEADREHPPKSPEEIVQAAEANVGKLVEYDVWSSNCCHGATEARSGEPSSSEVESHSKFTLGSRVLLGNLGLWKDSRKHMGKR